MVFGVFDGLHDGHLYFLKQAKTYGEALIAVVARDTSAETLKGRAPEENELERLRVITLLTFVDEAVLGDYMQGVYSALKKFRPAVICVGYDQDLLEQDLKEKMVSGTVPRIPIVRVTAHLPEILHSSLKWEKPKTLYRP